MYEIRDYNNNEESVFVEAWHNIIICFVLYDDTPDWNSNSLLTQPKFSQSCQQSDFAWDSTSQFIPNCRIFILCTVVVQEMSEERMYVWNT